MNTTTDPNVVPASTTQSGYTHNYRPSTATNNTVVNDKVLAGNPYGNRRSYHPILFGLLALFSIIELGLTASYLRNAHHQGWPNSMQRSSDIFLLVMSIWTLIFSLMYMIFILTRAAHKGASMGSSALWLLLTSILWGIATGLYTTSRPSCNASLFSLFRNCREATAIEVFGWLIFATLILTLLSTVHHSGRHYARGNTGRYGHGYHV